MANSPASSGTGGWSDPSAQIAVNGGSWSAPTNPSAPGSPGGGNASDWYNTFSANSDWKDTQTYSDPQWEAWHQEQNAKGGAQAGCPPNLPFTGRNGQCAAKPDDCPDGMHVEGSDTNGTAKCVGNGANGGGGQGGGGGAGGAGGPGGGGGNYGDWTYGLAPMYQAALSDPKQAQALLLGSGGAANQQSAVDAINSKLAGLPAGSPERAALETQRDKLQTEFGLQAGQAGQQMAIQGLTRFAPTNASWLTSNLNRGEQAREYNMGNALGWGQLNANTGLGYAQLGQQANQFGQSLDWQKNQFNQTFPEQQREFNANLDWAKQNANNQQKSSMWGNIIGGVTGLAAGIFSDVRAKENIAPGRRGLSELRRLKVYSYNYKPSLDPEKRKMMGVMAQDVEKVAPEMVIEGDPSGYKKVNAYSLLSMTMNAVKDLDLKLSSLAEKANAH